MKSIMCLLTALAILAGCASVGVKRDIFDERGRKVATIKAEGELLTPEGAGIILASAHQLERTKLDGKAEARVARVAEKSVQKGEPTMVATRGGRVSSGYVGYDGYGYGPYGGNPYGAYGYDPSVAPDFIAIEEAGRRDGRDLPSLGTSIVTGIQTPLYPHSWSVEEALGTCPTNRAPADVAESTACNRRDINEILRTRTRKRK